MLEEVYEQLLAKTQPTAVLITGLETAVRILWPLNSHVLVYPGSWNPLHRGHIAIYRAAMASAWEMEGGFWPQAPVIWEMSVNPRGKEPLTYEDVRNRYEQFTGPVLLTNAQFFHQKIEALQVFDWRENIEFQVGSDTARRILEDHTRAEIEQYRANFRVWQRAGAELVFSNKQEFKRVWPKNFCIGEIQIPKHLSDLSSTALRQA